MGASGSIQSQSKRISSKSQKIRSGPSDSVAEKIRRMSSGVKVVIVSDGRLQEYRTPVKARDVTSRHTGCFLGSSEHISIGTCVPRVPDDEDLSPAQIYFLLPEAQAQRIVSLADLCSLAIKTSSLIGKSSAAVHISPTNGNSTGVR